LTSAVKPIGKTMDNCN